MSLLEPPVSLNQKPYPGLAQSLLVLLLFLVFSTLLALPWYVLTALKLTRWAQWALVLGQLGGVFLTFKVCLSKGRLTWANVLPHQTVSHGVWPLTLVVSMGLILVLNGIDGWVNHLVPASPAFRQAFMPMGWPSIVVGAPLCEEALFRGLILGGFALRYGATRGILYSALLFGLIHMNPWQLPAGLVLGVFYGWLTLRTGSLWPPVFAHLLNNLFVTLAYAYQVPHLSDPGFQPFWMWSLGLLLTGSGLASLVRSTARFNPRIPPQFVSGSY